MQFFTRLIFSTALTPVVVASVVLTPLPARAQFGDPGTLGGILEDILGQVPQTATETQIDNIPITIESAPNFTADGHILIVTAYAPAKPSGRFDKPDILGQTQLLLRGLTFPLDITVSTPSNVTQSLDFARLEAKIIDTNGNPAWTAKTDGIYRGADPIVLDMVPAGSSNAQEPSSAPVAIGLETIYGKIELAQKSEIFRGSTLTVQLVESGLAGGNSTLIAAESVTDLDLKDAPFDFKLDRSLYTEEDEKSYALNAWINDWAGRRTHVLEQPVPYNGVDRNYTLTLDRYATGRAPTDRLAEASLTRIQGIAEFDAYKGLPAGSRLTATLSRSVGTVGAGKTLTRQTVLLDGLSGNVKFDLTASSTNFDPLIPSPVLDVKITGAQGQVFFSAEGISAREGVNLIQLYQSAEY